MGQDAAVEIPPDLPLDEAGHRTLAPALARLEPLRDDSVQAVSSGRSEAAAAAAVPPVVEASGDREVERQQL